MMKKRLSAALLAACLVLTLLPTCALAAWEREPYNPDQIWIIPSLTEARPGPSGFIPGDKENNAEITWSRLNNLLWLGFVIQDGFVLPYTDVPEDSWFYPGVCYVYTRSLMNGVTEDTFAPEELVTRGLAWSVLAGMNGVNTAPKSGEAWYEPGMVWAVEHGVTDGSNPLDLITREQWAAMLWRRAGYPEAGVDLSAYSDGGAVSGYAQDAMRWAVSTGMIQPYQGQLSPQSPFSRGELATMIMQLVPKTK